MIAAVNAQAKVLREIMTPGDRWFGEPRTQASYTICDRNWSGRKVGAALAGVWSLCVTSYFFLAMLLPGPWLAVRLANTLLGGSNQAVCALVNYRMATDSCRTQFEGRPGRMVVRAARGAPEGKL